MMHISGFVVFIVLFLTVQGAFPAFEIPADTLVDSEGNLIDPEIPELNQPEDTEKYDTRLDDPVGVLVPDEEIPKMADATPALKIAAFKIRILGKTKASKPEVMNSLVKILTRYDIIFVQDIREKSGESLPKLVAEMNKMIPLGTNPYKYKNSSRMGSTRSKVQTAYVYRSDKADLKKTYEFQATDDMSKSFERPPFMALFASRITEMPEFVVIGIQVRPDKAVAELNKLDDVYNHISELWNTKDVIIAGNMAADCRYVSKTKWTKNVIDMWKDKATFTWLIDNNADTTVKQSTDCAYDRFVVTGRVKSEVVPSSAQVYLFDKDLGLTEPQALAVSDHYPIELELRPKKLSEAEMAFGPFPPAA